ncbi:MAG: hypothetical protein ACTSW8_08700 [Candidatus Thorarchaeota archaeon]
MRNKVPFILCLIGGALMLYAGVIGSVGIWGDILALAATLAPGFAKVMGWILTILVNIASMGGIAVIIGGYLIITNRVGTGKFIIGIAAGMGLFGFIILIYTMYTAMGMAAFGEILNLLSTSAALAGPVITIIARTMAKKPE